MPYQRRWVLDSSPFKIVVKARQIGYSFAATLRAVLECTKKKTTWIFLSKGERQSRLLMEKVQEHIQSCGIVARAREATFFEGTLLKQLEVRFPNGSVIYGLPANPHTARGYTGNVTLDEFAFHQDAAKVYSALYPTITRGYSIEVISTPNGQQGKFFELAKAAGLTEGNRESGVGSRVSDSRFRTGDPPGRPYSLATESGVGSRKSPTPDSLLPTPYSGWSGHQVSIYDAVAQGLEIDLDALRAGCDDEETWLQEYCCAFLSDAANYIPMELIMACVSEQASTGDPAGRPYWPVGATHRVARTSVATDHGQRTTDSPLGDLYLGIDIGRKRDLTVAWLFEKLGDVLWSRVLLTMKAQTFDTQETAICDLIEGNRESGVGSRVPDSRFRTGDPPGRPYSLPTVRRCCVDQSGLGMMLAERLEKKYGAIIEPVQFTAQVKERLAPRVKQAFEDRLVRIPDNREVRADINAVKRFVTPAGNVRFDAEHTDRGHADRFWALALALNAAAEPTVHLAGVGALVGKPVAAGLRERVL